jgi:tetratricopeptide (TPR) repeat protein
MFGNAYMRKNNIADAFTEYKKSIEASPTFVQGYVNLGAIYSRQDNCREAIKNYNKAKVLNPNYAEVYYNLAICYLKENNHASAVTILEDARGRFVLNEKIHTLLATVYFETGYLEKAKVMIEKSILLNPQDYEVRMIHKQIMSGYNKP